MVKRRGDPIRTEFDTTMIWLCASNSKWHYFPGLAPGYEGLSRLLKKAVGDSSLTVAVQSEASVTGSLTVAVQSEAFDVN